MRVAVIAGVGAAVTATVVFWHAIVTFLLTLALIRIGWLVLRAKLGLRPVRRVRGQRLAALARVVEAAGVVVIARHLSRDR